MQDREPTIRSRELGEGLRTAMERAGLTGKQVADQLGLSQSWISRLLAGKRKATAVQVAGFLDMCRVTGEERDRLLELCEDEHNLGWLQQRGAPLPQQLVTLIDHERKAVTISAFQAQTVPDLLRTGDYAHALLRRSSNTPEREVDGLVAATLARQSLLSRENPADFTYYVHESALRLPVGGAVVMSEQLQQLLRMSLRPYLTLRVVPIALGAHAAMAGSFTLLEFADFRPVVYLENEVSGLFLETPVEIDAYQRILGALEKTALGAEESRELIAALDTELYPDREDPFTFGIDV
ncbi:MAG: helix-turn-helix domain-containing protein [Pseudonocardiaceae bacterium]